jgi:hypothetical protein
LDNLEIGGTMYAQPESTVEIKKFVITSSGAVNITTPINLRGETLDNSGTLDIDYRRWPENTDEGNEKTNIYMEKVRDIDCPRAGNNKLLNFNCRFWLSIHCSTYFQIIQNKVGVSCLK